MSTTLRVPMDPDDADDLTWDWADRLASGETISAASVTVTAGAVVGSPTISGSDVTARINAAGGTPASDGGYINARCRITTSTARQIDWTLQIPIKAQ